MSRVEAIELEIKQLSPAEFAQLREWVLQEDQASWDLQFDANATSGRLDSVFKQSALG